MSTTTTFQQYLQTAFINGYWSTDEVVEFILPLFEEVLSFHENGLVASFEKPDSVFLNNGRLDIDESFSHPPISKLSALNELLQNAQVGGYQVMGAVQVEDDLSQYNQSVTNLQVEINPNKTLTHAVFLPGYLCYELKLGHHDAQTDICCLGLILGSLVMALDLYDPEDLHQFAAYRTQPAALNERMHPTLCAMVTEMTELDRSRRAPDLQELLHRLKYYRDYDPQRQVDLTQIAAFQVKQPADRKAFILSKLRNRLFDTSRRNRLLYYKPNSRFVNLTVSSVPLVLHYQSINPQLLLVWNKEMESIVVGMKDLSLNKYLRFEDHPYLNAQLNGIRHQSDNDKKEYGFSQLKLVVAFLHWHNLKEEVNERIQSPLLLLPVELERKKSLKEERFTVKITDNTAIVNPVLANHLKDLYGILLPESIDFDEVSMEQFFQLLQAQINAARQGVQLNYIDQPRIKLVHSIARQTINNYRKKMKMKGTPSFQHIDYSYSEENYKPLGLELFKQKVEAKPSELEFLLSDIPAAANTNHFAQHSDASIKASYQLTDGESNPYSWDFDCCNLVLGNFNYKKMSLVSDYNALTEKPVDHRVFNELFSEQPRQQQDTTTSNNPAEWFHVINADPTQSKAILYSRTGNSYIIQGPPGTGKSQTITNLIADFLAKGKTILFVCEKRAALDVVYHRLKQNQLSELCCYIHDSQGDKKEFIRDLKTVYEDFQHNKMDLASISLQRKIVLEQLLEKMKLLNAYHQQQRTVNPEAGLPLRQLLEKLLQLKPSIPKMASPEWESTPHYQQWLEFGDTISQLSKALEDSGAEPQLSSHPFSNLAPALLTAENPFTLMDSLLTHARNNLQQLTDLIKQHNLPAQHASQLEKIKNLIQDSTLMEPLAQSGNLQLVEAANPQAREFEQAYQQYQQVKAAYQESLESTGNWANKFSKQETEQALAIASSQEHSFFKFMNGDWRRLKKQLNQSYNFSAHQLAPAFSNILQQLKEEYRLQDQIKKSKDDLQQRYRVSNIDTVYIGIDVLRRKQGDQEIDFLLQHPDANQLVLALSKLNNTLQQLELQLKQCLVEYAQQPLAELSDELTSIHHNADALKDLLPWLRRFAALPEPLQQFIRKLPVTPLQAEAAMAHKTVQLLMQRNPGFASTNQAVLQEGVQEIERSYKRLLQLNSDYIRAERRQKFLQHYEISNQSVSNLSPEQRQLKKDYTEGRRILEHEMSKSMRYKSIREMASDQSGKVLKDIKPVWLMSPLSVSDSLPLDPGYFDVVIFDEASQITLEEGIPALFRAPQTIIVGDEKQMPPSNFFHARTEDPQDLETFEGESEDEILSTEADSLLVQGSRKLNSSLLSWHYRSRYETLISYSNHAFYEAGLLTIPDKTIHHNNKPLLEVLHTEEASANAGLLLKDSISFHYLPNSIYEARSNLSEAKYIAQMVHQLLKDNVPESIGVVAFSQEQQGIIEAAIETLAATDKEFEDALERAYNRTEEGQFTGLFVKNLENVQGDERDIIIMSVCYGHDGNKKMLMNFGPINRRGGEKRLNVIFSRAKKHMAIVSSIRHQHITNDHNDGASYFKRFLQYAEMVSTGNMATARLILDGLMTSQQQLAKPIPTASVTASQIKKALEARGFVVDQQIGQSRFKCSLGVKKQANEAEYTLGILIDDIVHYENDDLIEQYYQRPSILQSFGWSIAHVYAKDWLEDSDRVLSGLLRKLAGGEVASVDPSPVVVTRASFDKPVDELEFTRLVSESGDRFWEVAVKDLQLHIRYGRIGARGLVQVKTFATEEEVQVAKEQMIEEQVGSGGWRKDITA
jgi:predicted DNA-binding WGR domain protein/DNA polymerase III delta prime subunit